ncbi:MAG TPA: Scr1 family TA system antitoxin-like transcriptional regulator [Pseudonocardiaceae bacterium]|nr:Scr1 family TA system antitoxin-like transcriptional regulator [Pseudonocardiaceae bacterium]
MQTGAHYWLITEATVADGSPTMRMRQLGMELRRLRDLAGKTQEEAAAWINKTDTTISKYENGARRIDVGNLRSLCQLYDVEVTHLAFLERLVRESGERGWWAEFGSTVPHWFADFLGMETVATEVWTYESEPIPGLLQTEEYARAVAPTDAERVTKLRATRQKRLTDDNPLILRAVLNEAVLCRVVGGPEVMRRQIRHVIDTTALPNVTIQVLPFSAGFHPAMTGSFTALRFPEVPMMNTVYVEIEGAALYVEKPRGIDRYTANFERLTELALDESGTISFLEQMEGRYSTQ